MLVVLRALLLLDVERSVEGKRDFIFESPIFDLDDRDIEECSGSYR
jgi:hypothetical protein